MIQHVILKIHGTNEEEVDIELRRQKQRIEERRKERERAASEWIEAFDAGRGPRKKQR